MSADRSKPLNCEVPNREILNREDPNRDVTVRVPGRINLIGDHTDYTGGLVLPMVVDLHTTITGSHTEDRFWSLESDSHGHSVIPLDLVDPRAIEPEWARYVAGVLVEMRGLGIPLRGFIGTVSTTIPIGAGLSSSAALEIAVARVVIDGADRPELPSAAPVTPIDIARACQRAEHAATGVPCGIMDQLSIVAGSAGHATLIDCSTLEVTRVALPESVCIEHRFIASRALIGSEYADRVSQCADIERRIGPLQRATPRDIDTLDSELLRKRARHVITENIRVREFVDALETSDVIRAGRLMVDSHTSLARDFETSTAQMDAAVETALGEPGVLGARMTGGGFGGCIVIMRSA